ncbi:hypothetical protein EON67_04945, partial [archaeon]
MLRCTRKEHSSPPTPSARVRVQYAATAFVVEAEPSEVTASPLLNWTRGFKQAAGTDPASSPTVAQQHTACCTMRSCFTLLVTVLSLVHLAACGTQCGPHLLVASPALGARLLLNESSPWTAVPFVVHVQCACREVGTSCDLTYED